VLRKTRGPASLAGQRLRDAGWVSGVFAESSLSVANRVSPGELNAFAEGCLSVADPQPDAKTARATAAAITRGISIRLRPSQGESRPPTLKYTDDTADIDI
jgi:hypothetical protein